MNITEKNKRNFWKRVEVSNTNFWNNLPCWEWKGYCNSDGYGKISISRRIESCHRISWIIENGILNDGDLVLHHCDNRCCVNPSHLFIGNQFDNMRDMNEKGRGNHPKGTRVFLSNKPRSEKHYKSKLSKEDACEIRRLHSTGNYFIKDLSVMFNVSAGNISCIVNNKTWKE